MKIPFETILDFHAHGCPIGHEGLLSLAVAEGLGAKGGGKSIVSVFCWNLISYQRARLLMLGEIRQGHGVDQKWLLYLFGPLH
jgi:hypothetical protein